MLKNTVLTLAIYLSWWNASLVLYLSADENFWNKLTFHGIGLRFSDILGLALGSLLMLSLGAYPAARNYKKLVWIICALVMIITFRDYGITGPLGVLFGQLGLTLARKVSSPKASTHKK